MSSPAGVENSRTWHQGRGEELLWKELPFPTARLGGGSASPSAQASLLYVGFCPWC